LKNTGSCKNFTSTCLFQPVLSCCSHLQLGCCTGFGTPENNLEVQTVGLVDTCAVLETNTRNIENSKFTQYLCLLNTSAYSILLDFPFRGSWERVWNFGDPRENLRGFAWKLTWTPVKTRILVVVIIVSPLHCTRGLSLRNPCQHPIQAVEPLHGIARGVCLPVHRNSGHRLIIRIHPKLNMYRYLPPGLFD